MSDIANSITSFGNNILNWVSNGIIGDIFLIIYTFILIIFFFILQIGFIYAYFKMGQSIKKVIPIISDWFDLNKDRFSNLLDKK